LTAAVYLHIAICVFRFLPFAFSFILSPSSFLLHPFFMSSILGQTILSQYRVDAFVTHTPLGELYRGFDMRRNQYVGLTVLPKSVA
jgi:hypothetical protein